MQHLGVEMRMHFRASSSGLSKSVIHRWPGTLAPHGASIAPPGSPRGLHMWAFCFIKLLDAAYCVSVGGVNLCYKRGDSLPSPIFSAADDGRRLRRRVTMPAFC